MKYEIQEALDEIMDIPPIYRRDFVIDYMRRNLPEDDARKILLNKTKAGFIRKMIAEGYITKEEVLEKIGKERVKRFLQSMRTLS